MPRPVPSHPRALADLDLSVPPPQGGSEIDDTWRYPWPAGARLADDLDALAQERGIRWEGLRVCDLGCGRGHLGLIAARRGATVTFADGSASALAAVELVARRAGTAINSASTTFVQHAWGEPIAGRPFDLILAGDLLYRPAFFTALATSLVASLSPGGAAWCSDPRSGADADWLAAVAAAGGATACERRGTYTLCTVRNP